MGELRTLPNIGAEIERQLCEVGIDTIDTLKQVGAREAWLRILAADPSACLNRLMGLEGALRGVRYFGLDDATKDDLRAFYRLHKKG
ncbi:TfoX/Sxy family protein [Oscillospiraceae bacterium OttesenSCG-928-G22]|nr:TfoX/Sxy family protein [Oscillospiraceae bacterium OttesenSCG-928-G22]